MSDFFVAKPNTDCLKQGTIILTLDVNADGLPYVGKVNGEEVPKDMWTLDKLYEPGKPWNGNGFVQQKQNC